MAQLNIKFKEKSTIAEFNKLKNSFINGKLCESSAEVVEQLMSFYKENSEKMTLRNDEGKKVKGKSSVATNARIKAFIDAVIAYNEKASKRERIFISNSFVQNLGFSVNSNTLSRFFEEYKSEIDEHHTKLNINEGVNKRFGDRSQYERGFVGKKPILKLSYEIIEKAGLKDVIYKGLPITKEKPQ